MKFTCEKALLVSALSVAGRTVAQRSTIACLEGILLRASEDGLELTGYNLETGITVTVGADVTDAGECVMPARLFSDIIRKMPDEEITVTVDEKMQVSVRGGVSSFRITAMDSDDYPELPNVRTELGVTMPQSVLREMISGTIFSVSENQARPIHTGCLFEIDGNRFDLVAVDTIRLARRSWDSEEPLGEHRRFVVPAASLREVEKILQDTDESVRFTVGDRHIIFRIGEASLVCRLLDGEFIDWRRVIPKEHKVLLTANVAALTASIERVSLIISEKAKSCVRCVFGKDEVDLSTQNTVGAAHDVCALAGNGEELEIGFNARYLLDALRAVPTQEVALEMQNGVSPLVFTPVDASADFAYMVLPVRLR